MKQLTPIEERYLEYSLDRKFIKSQNAVNSTKTKLKQGKKTFSKKDEMLIKLLTLPTLTDAMKLLETEREFFNNQK